LVAFGPGVRPGGAGPLAGLSSSAALRPLPVPPVRAALGRAALRSALSGAVAGVRPAGAWGRALGRDGQAGGLGHDGRSGAAARGRLLDDRVLLDLDLEVEQAADGLFLD